jgi:predicted phosphodiesterase
LSDLHIEFGDLNVAKVDADVGVLAGDTHVGLRAATWSTQLAEQLGMPIVLIAGNHEHYGSVRHPDRDFVRTVDGLRAVAAASAGRVVYLERESAVVAGVRFIGATLWTDFRLFGNPAKAMADADKSMIDFHTIGYRPGARFTPNDARHEFMLAKDFLRKELATTWDGPTVVVTHHLPSYRSLALQFAGNPLSPAFASHLDELVETSCAEYWIHGHTHHSCDYKIGRTRVVCNPRGYATKEVNPAFNPRLVVS